MGLRIGGRSTLAASALIVTLAYVLALSYPLRGQGTRERIATAGRPGDAPYTPTKLEWTALELQAGFGRTWTTEDHVAISYMPAGDGRTIRCILQYTPDVSAQDLKMSRDVAKVLFDKYTASRGWTWIRLGFEEQILPRPH